MELSARNKLPGTISAITLGEVREELAEPGDEGGASAGDLARADRSLGHRVRNDVCEDRGQCRSGWTNRADEKNINRPP